MKTRALTISAFEAKNRFSELIHHVSRGAEVTITKHDTPVAKLVPAANAFAIRQRAAAELRQLRPRYTLKGTSVQQLIDEGHR